MARNIIKTDRTYKTHENATKALKKACDKVGLDFDNDPVEYFIGTADNGRFAPAVRLTGCVDRIHHQVNCLLFQGITIF